MDLKIQIYDRTLAKINAKILADKKLEAPRHYLGMSQIGEECERKLFYSFRCCEIDEQNIIGTKAANDGHRQELEMAKHLQSLPFIELYTEDSVTPGEQIGYELLLGHFRGHLDGIIRGIVEAPKTWHVWEHKSKDKSMFNKLKKIRQENGEKLSLKMWNIIYYAQAIIYMHSSKLSRHYMTVSTPGGRDAISIRTDYNQKYAEMLIDKAQRIIFENNYLPPGTSDKKEVFACKFCPYIDICHDKQFPLVHCKTCRYREPVKNGENFCHFKKEDIDKKYLHMRCNNHIYNPALIQAKLVDQQLDCCVYQLENKTYLANCSLSGLPEMNEEHKDVLIYTSTELRDNIQFLPNLEAKKAIEVCQAVSGTFENSEKKAWDKREDFGADSLIKTLEGE